MKSKLLKLAKMLINFAVTEIQGLNWLHDGELAVGTEVFIEDENGEFIAVADGEYTKDDVVYKVENGVITEIEVKEQVDEKLEEEPIVEEPKDNMEELQARIAELEALLTEKEATITELTAQIEALTTEVETLKNKPVEEPVKMNATPREKQSENKALKYFE